MSKLSALERRAWDELNGRLPEPAIYLDDAGPMADIRDLDAAMPALMELSGGPYDPDNESQDAWVERRHRAAVRLRKKARRAGLRSVDAGHELTR